MDAVALIDENGRALRLRRMGAADGTASYEAVLSLPGGTMACEVYEPQVMLAEYFEDLASNWRGWKGAKEYESLEGQLLLSARHNRLGTVTISVALRRSAPPTWSFEAELHFGAGAQLERIAKEIAKFQRQ